MTDNHTQANATGGIGLVTVLLALIFLFVWPGPFRYDYRVDNQSQVMRIDRLNGNVQTYSDGRYTNSRR